MDKDIPNKTITIEKIKEMFTNISLQTNWDLSQPMEWEYYFTHSSSEPLDRLKIELTSLGYNFVSIHEAEEDEADDTPLWWLIVKKEEIHTPFTLDKKNDTLYLLANKFHINTYDGMNVAPIKH